MFLFFSSSPDTACYVSFFSNQFRNVAKIIRMHSVYLPLIYLCDTYFSRNIWLIYER